MPAHSQNGGDGHVTRVLSALTGVAALGLCLVCLCGVLQAGATAGRAAFATVCLIAMLTLCRQGVRAGGRMPVSRQVLMLLGQTAVVVVPLPVFGTGWLSVSGFLAGSLLVMLHGRPRLLTFTLVSLAVTGYLAARADVAHDGVAAGVGAAVSAVLLYALGAIVVVAEGCAAGRSRVLQAEIAKERSRFARDLHDLLGYSLSAVTLKAELALRMVGAQPKRAKGELAEVIRLSRQAAADVRTVASGYRELTLEYEAMSAQTILAAADVQTAIDLADVDIPQPMQTVLATVLREAVTNVLRHSAATTCAITLRRTGDRLSMEIVNDGAFEPQRAFDADGSGMRNLAARLRSLRGDLAVRFDDDLFYLRASVPM